MRTWPAVFLFIGCGGGDDEVLATDSGSGPIGDTSFTGKRCSDYGHERHWTTRVETDVAVLVDSIEYFTQPRPVQMAVSDSGDVWVVWVGSDGVHATPLDASDQRAGDDLVVPGDDLRGVVAHDDGLALLVVRGDAMHLSRLDREGGLLWDVQLAGGNNHDALHDTWVNQWGHNGRLAWSGADYAAYFGHTRNFDGAGDVHQGDQLAIVSAAGDAQSAGWSWGCSHSDDARIVFTGSGPQDGFLPVCGSDCFPETGIVYDNRTTILMDPSGDCTGSIDTELGSLLAWGSDALLVMATPVSRPSYDLAYVWLRDGEVHEAPTFLTESNGLDERFVHVARYGVDELLLAWVESKGEVVLSRTDRDLQQLENAMIHEALLQESADLITHVNGDVGWAHATEDGALAVVRMAWCPVDS